MRKLIHLFIPCCLFALAACNSSHNKMLKEESLEKMLKENPDSLAKVLEEKINLNELSAKDKADYAYWLTKTHEKQRRSLMNDSLIHYAVAYYKKTESPHLLDASLLAADQINWSDTARSQQEHLLNESMQIAIQQKDTAGMQQVCSRLARLYEMPADSGKIRDLIQVTKKYATDQNVGFYVNVYVNLTTLFARLAQQDSAFLYYRKGIELAQKQHDNMFEFDLTRSYAASLSATGKGKEAISMLRDLERRMGTADNGIRFSYIITWINLGQLDSAQVYIDSTQSFFDNIKNQSKLRLGDDIEFHQINLLLGIFQEIVRAKEGKTLSMTEMSMAANTLIRKIRNYAKINQEQQFANNKLIQNNLQLDIERGKMKQGFLWVGIIVLLIIASIIYIYQRKLLKKERSEQKAKEQLRLHTLQLTENEAIIRRNEEMISSLSSQLDENEDLKQEIAQLNEENETLKGKNKTLQKDIEYNSKSVDQKDADFEIFEKLAEQNARLQERERFLTARLIAHTDVLDKLSKKPRYIEKSQQPEIINAINQLFDGLSYRLHVDYPTLTEEDIFYCCLFKLRLSTSIVGLLMGISPSSVTKRKQRIKEKMSQQFSEKNQNEKLLEIYSWN
ncbi:MAG: hypothetical protein FWD60_06465 [Candidatus Azobacteroides sp.]|nr:hypothetical protein [Candidatus Azobacteroides sp.]